MGVIMRSTVRNAAKFAVYEETMIKVKNHQIPLTILVEVACGRKVAAREMKKQRNY